MRSFEAAIRVEAPPEVVWGLLADVGGWRDWDSGVDRVEGRVVLGGQLTIYATMIRKRPFRVTVTDLRPNEGMRWEGGVPFRLATIERTYRLDAQDDGATELTVREDQTGPLLPWLERTTPDLNPSFRQFCEGLKARAERNATRPAG